MDTIERDHEIRDRESDFYQKLRIKIREWLQSKEGSSHQWVKYLMWAPDLFHVLCKLSLDDDVPTKEKAKLAAAIAYFVSPLDFMPEFIIGPAGYLDDIAISAYVLNSLLNHTNPDVLRRHWAGEDDVLHVIQSILRVAEKMVGSGLWAKLRRRF
jgi:uncharacterized membrane protein YkvA (DUF1232 family)